MLTKLFLARFWSEWAHVLKASPAKTLLAIFRNTAIGNKVLQDTGPECVVLVASTAITALASSVYSYAEHCCYGLPVCNVATASDEQFTDMDMSCTEKEVGRVKVMPPSSLWALSICPLCYLPLPWAPGALPLPAGPPIRHQGPTAQPLTPGPKALLPLLLQTSLLPSARC